MSFSHVPTEVWIEHLLPQLTVWDEMRFMLCQKRLRDIYDFKQAARGRKWLLGLLSTFSGQCELIQGDRTDTYSIDVSKDKFGRRHVSIRSPQACTSCKSINDVVNLLPRHDLSLSHLHIKTYCDLEPSHIVAPLAWCSRYKKLKVKLEVFRIGLPLSSFDLQNRNGYLQWQTSRWPTADQTGCTTWQPFSSSEVMSRFWSKRKANWVTVELTSPQNVSA